MYKSVQWFVAGVTRLIGFSVLLLCCLFLGGCVIGVESVDDAPMSHYNPDDDTAERMYSVPVEEAAETDREVEKNWDAGGHPLPKGGFDPFEPY